ncbi:MAG: energy-coupling factor transporter transmembrane component T [Eubacteriales bacterium]|nr:energy-coupling factor transporter transmembrane component T [Eubacteriales bacterium]
MLAAKEANLELIKATVQPAFPWSQRAKIHPALPLSLQAFFSVYLFFYNSPTAIAFFVICSLALLAYLRRWRRLILFIVANLSYLSLIVFLQARAEPGNYAQIALMAIFIIFPILCFGPLGSIVLLDTPVPDILYFLQKLRLPRRFILALAIILRFLPTYSSEARLIRQSFKIRGIQLSLKRPLISWGYLIMPVLLRLEAISLELSAAAISRGIENPQPRTSYSLNSLKPWELIFMLFVFTVLIILAVSGS